MANIQWILGVEPTKLPSAWRERIQKLFLEETGEAYADVSIASLPIPAWEGNLLLVDMNTYPAPASLKGLLWALPFLEEGVRIAAFAITAEMQNFGWGSLAWHHLVRECSHLVWFFSTICGSKLPSLSLGVFRVSSPCVLLSRLLP